MFQNRMPWEMDPEELARAAGGAPQQPPRGFVPGVRPAPPPPQLSPRHPDQARSGAADAALGEYRAGTTPRRDRFSDENTLRQQFNSLPDVQRYREVVPLYVSARDAADTRAGDLNLIYAFGKLMDPGSVVREGEMVMVQGTGTTADRLRSLFTSEINRTGRLNPQTRRELLNELQSRRLQLAQSYANARDQYAATAREYGFDPMRVLGEHPAQPYADQEERQRQSAPAVARELQQAYDRGASRDELLAIAGRDGRQVDPSRIDAALAARGTTGARFEPEAPPPPGGSYNDSLLSQGLSGLNVGIANTLGLPVDLVTSVINMIPGGINAIANTSLPQIENPIGGGDWWQRRFGSAGAIGPESNANPAAPFVRRVGESVGGAVIPIAGTAGTLARAGMGGAAALGGGIGAATAQQVAPGNPYAEFAGEMIGSVGAGAGAVGAARRAGRRRTEAAVPTVERLRAQASDLYRRAEARGVVGGPNVTTNIAERIRRIASDAELVDDAGNVSPMYPQVGEALRVMGRYNGQTINPTQIQVIREGLADAVQATEGRQRNIARQMLRAFDQETTPLAPELRQARAVASRYLQANRIGLARENSRIRSSNYSQSGEENALRTDFRALDRAIARGDENFPPSVVEAIQGVSRGTPMSNAARGVGRLAPRGVVSMGMGGGVPFMVGNAIGGPVLGGAMGGGAMALGEGGRALATAMTRRQADLADVLARAGGQINYQPVMDPELQRLLASLGVTQTANASAPFRY